jgi:1,4-dihydroxy-2-naphthoate octaprenyltransferase
MKVNFAMWKTALSQLVKMDSVDEWNALDVISKWLIATRSAVTKVTLYSCAIAGLLAWRDHVFAWVPFLVVTIGLFIAHGTNNLLNDYTDFSRGVDSDNYFRTQYGVHPLVQNFWTKRQQIQWFAVSGALAFLSGVFALFYTKANPVVFGLFAFGALVLLFYTWPLKYLALGELAIFVIWGPIMIAGAYFVMAAPDTSKLWSVALAGIPFGLSVVSINLGKHIDKRDQDQKKRVHTLPVVIGDLTARILNMLVLVGIYGVTIYLVATHYFTPLLLIVLFAGRRLFFAVAVLFKPRPAEPPKEWPGWPTWFSGFAFYHNALFGNLFLVGLLLDTILRVFFPDIITRFWPM